MRFKAFSLVLAASLLIPTPTVAEITDSVDFPFNSRTFDSATRYGTEYRDSLTLASWNRLRSGLAPFTGQLTLIFSQNINMKKYTFETDLISPSGKVIPLALQSEFISKSEFSISCYGNSCQTVMLNYRADLPIESEIGKYSLRFTARWVGVKCTGTVCESGVPLSKSIEAKGALEILGEVTSTPTPTSLPLPTTSPKSTSIKNSKSTILCTKGKKVKKVTAVKPKCSKGFKKK